MLNIAALRWGKPYESLESARRLVEERLNAATERAYAIVEGRGPQS